MEMALYRKYRPQAFDEVMGQEHVVNALLGAVRGGTVSHAYLFSGSRGTGKTSVARIFARAIGCSEKDLYEIDAASNRGIDEVRILREGVHVVPFESPYKVYIIDEAHMLTKEAANALLKTLEEPPKHAVFILATTEMHKLPETVVSRCETHHFRKPTHALLEELAVGVAKKEGYQLDRAAADLIAMLGDGSFRDTHGILQKALSATKNKNITLAEVEMLTGAPPAELVRAMLEAMGERNLSKALAALQKTAERNVDMKVFAKLLLHRMRAVLLLRFAKDLVSVIKDEVSESDFVFLEKLSKDPKSGIDAGALQEFLGAYEHIGRAYIPHLPIELALIKLLEKDA